MALLMLGRISTTTKKERRTTTPYTREQHPRTRPSTPGSFSLSFITLLKKDNYPHHPSVLIDQIGSLPHPARLIASIDRGTTWNRNQTEDLQSTPASLYIFACSLDLCVLLDHHEPNIEPKHERMRTHHIFSVHHVQHHQTSEQPAAAGSSGTSPPAKNASITACFCELLPWACRGSSPPVRQRGGNDTPTNILPFPTSRTPHTQTHHSFLSSLRLPQLTIRSPGSVFFFPILSAMISQSNEFEQGPLLFSFFLFGSYGASYKRCSNQWAAHRLGFFFLSRPAPPIYSLR